MTEHTLPPKVAAEDQKLTKTATDAQEALAKLRWRWTLDESNPDRVSLRAYSKAVKVDRAVISRYAKGYASWIADDGGATRVASLSEQIARAETSADRQAATDAVAKAMGTTYANTRTAHTSEVREVLELAREKAEANGTAVADEAPAIAERREETRKALRDVNENRKKRGTLRGIQALHQMATAVTLIQRAARELEGVHDLSDEEVETLWESVGAAKHAIGLVELAMDGTTHTDWDSELADLTKGE